MNVLAYLLSEPLSTVPGAGSVPLSHPPRNKSTRILLGWRTTYDGDEEQLQSFSKILLSRKKEATFETLRKNLPFRWNEDEKYDTINPFGDPRQLQYQALWTFDTQKDVLRFTNAKHCSQIPLAYLREHVVCLADMDLLGKPVPSPLELALDSALPCWKPQIELNARMRAFTYRLLCDFHHQWRHVFRNGYNTITLKVLARGIVRLATLDFEVRHNTGGHGPRGVHVWITELPTWEPFETNVVRVGSIFVVICQTIQEGLSIAKLHLSSGQFGITELVGTSNSSKTQADYLILSVRHIVLLVCEPVDKRNESGPLLMFSNMLTMVFMLNV